MVGVRGFELLTSCSQSRRATGLRYTPTVLPLEIGSVTRTRTWDPMINSHLLYRLSYHGTIFSNLSISDAAFDALQHNKFSKSSPDKSGIYLTEPTAFSASSTCLHRCVHVSEARYSTFPETPVNPLNCFQDNDLRIFCGSPFSPRKSCGSVNKSPRIKKGSRMESPFAPLYRGADQPKTISSSCTVPLMLVPGMKPPDRIN